MSQVVEELVNKVRRREIVLWAGTGMSFYSGMPSCNKLIEAVVDNTSDENKCFIKNKSLADMTEEFESIYGRRKLLDIIKREIEIEPKDTSYHIMLTEIPQIKTIITTNYDTLFERVYEGNLQKIVSNQEIPYNPRHNAVKLYKIHGDFSYEKNILLTKGDYTNFYNNENQPLWVKIKSILLESSILFIGYSFEDSNIEFIFNNITDFLKGQRNKCYFVSPNLPKHKQIKLINKDIEYIDMTGEEIIGILHKNIRENLLIDCINEDTQPKEIIEILKKSGIVPKFSMSEKGVILTSITNSGDNSYTGKLTLKSDANIKMKEKLFKLIRGDFIGQLEIDISEVENIECNVSGVKLPIFFNSNFESGKLIMETLPKTTLVIKLILDKSNQILKDVVVKRYLTKTNNKLTIQFKKVIIVIDIYVERGIIDFKYENLLFEDAFDGLEFVHFMLEWFNGEKIIIINEDGYTINEFKVEDFLEFKLEKVKEQLISLKKIYENIIIIQKHYGIIFKIPKNISRKMMENMGIVLNYINKTKIPGENLKSTLINYNRIELNELLYKEGGKSLTFIENKTKKIRFFDKNIEVGKVCIEIPKAFIANRDEVIKTIEKGESEVAVTLSSKSNSMVFYYK